MVWSFYNSMHTCIAWVIFFKYFNFTEYTWLPLYLKLVLEIQSVLLGKKKFVVKNSSSYFQFLGESSLSYSSACLLSVSRTVRHHELWFSLPGVRLGLKGEVDRVINLFFEIGTWADITRCWPALWGVQRWVRSGCYLQEVEHRGWVACIKVWATVPTSETPANLLKRKFLSPTPDLVSHKLWGLGPKTWIFFLICG